MDQSVYNTVRPWCLRSRSIHISTRCARPLSSLFNVVRQDPLGITSRTSARPYFAKGRSREDLDPFLSPGETVTPTVESIDDESNFAAGFDAMSRLCRNSSQAFLASLDALSSSVFTGVPPVPRTENDPADILLALDAFSRLAPAQRRKLISLLTNLMSRDSSELAG